VHWVDTHCHLDASEFAADRALVRALAGSQGVVHCVIPAVEPANFDGVRELAHAGGDSYALGIHPLFVQRAGPAALVLLQQALQAHASDPRLLAVGEIGLDFFVPALQSPPLLELQEHCYREQLRLARKADLPVLLHVRRSADRLLKGLRDLKGSEQQWRGIAHAFNGSMVQAQEFIRLGFKLGFGGALTFERALQLRELARRLPLSALVLETDAPDIPPHWRYVTAAQRASGAAPARNEPGDLPRVAAHLAQLRGMDLAELAEATTHNACQALPGLAALLV
jgi:TatD DNase family protein